MLSRISHVRLCDPMDCSPPGSSVHGILQARILEWVATLSCRGSSRPRDRSPCLLWFLNCRWTLYPWTTGEVELLICNTRKVEILVYIRKNRFLFCSIFISASLPAPNLVINLLVLTSKTPILGVFVSTVGKFWHLFGYQLCANSSYDCQITKYYKTRHVPSGFQECVCMLAGRYFWRDQAWSWPASMMSFVWCKDRPECISICLLARSGGGCFGDMEQKHSLVQCLIKCPKVIFDYVPVSKHMPTSEHYHTLPQFIAAAFHLPPHQYLYAKKMELMYCFQS